MGDSTQHDQDNAVGAQYDSAAPGGGIWTPDCWHVSPDGLIAQARAKNEDGFRGVFAAAGRGSNPPAWSPDHELSK